MPCGQARSNTGRGRGQPGFRRIVGLTGRVLFASRQTWGLLGLADSDEMAGRSVFDCVSRATGRGWRRSLQPGESGAPKKHGVHGLARDGTTVPVDVSSVTIRDDAGQSSAVMAIIREITERKRAEQALERSNGLSNTCSNPAITSGN